MINGSDSSSHIHCLALVPFWALEVEGMQNMSACTCMYIFIHHACGIVSRRVKSQSLLASLVKIAVIVLLPPASPKWRVGSPDDLSVTIVIMVALISTGGCNAATCRLPLTTVWPAIWGSSWLTGGTWCMLVGRWHVQAATWPARYHLAARGFQHSCMSFCNLEHKLDKYIVNANSEKITCIRGNLFICLLGFHAWNLCFLHGKRSFNDVEIVWWSWTPYRAYVFLHWLRELPEIRSISEVNHLCWDSWGQTMPHRFIYLPLFPLIFS